MTIQNTIVTWASDAEPEKIVRVLNPDIPIAKYTFLYDTESFSAVATTPSMSLTNLSLTSSFYEDQLKTLQDWYGNPVVMEKYASGQTKTPEQTAERYKALAERWTYGNPYSGLMARNTDGKIVAMFNLGYALDDENKLRPGVTEFAGVINPEEWNKGLASEALVLLMVVVKCLSELGYKIGDEELTEVVTAVREDNQWADRALQNSALTFKYKKEIYDAPRNVYGATVTELIDILNNTDRSHSEKGTFFYPNESEDESTAEAAVRAPSIKC